MRVGKIESQVPKDREGRFQPSLFARYQRSEKAPVLALTEMYIQGVSTCRVQKVVEQLCWSRHEHAEIRRRTRVVRIFPNEASLVRLSSALAVGRDEQWMERRYLTINEEAPPQSEARQSA